MRKRFFLQMVCGWINKHKHSISNFSFYGSEIWHGIFSQGRHSLIWPIRVCAAEQGTIFKVLSLKQGIEFHYWGSWTGCLFGLEVNSKSVKTKWWAVYICNTNNFYLNLYFHNFSVKNYLILYAKQTNQGQKVVSPEGLKALAAHLFPNFSCRPPPPGDFLEVKFRSRDFLGFWLKP